MQCQVILTPCFLCNPWFSFLNLGSSPAAEENGCGNEEAYEGGGLGNGLEADLGDADSACAATAGAVLVVDADEGLR